jgi:hypothetical protein
MSAQPEPSKDKKELDEAAKWFAGWLIGLIGSGLAWLFWLCWDWLFGPHEAASWWGMAKNSWLGICIVWTGYQAFAKLKQDQAKRDKEEKERQAKLSDAEKAAEKEKAAQAKGEEWPPKTIGGWTIHILSSVFALLVMGLLLMGCLWLGKWLDTIWPKWLQLPF